MTSALKVSLSSLYVFLTSKFVPTIAEHTIPFNGVHWATYMASLTIDNLTDQDRRLLKYHLSPHVKPLTIACGRWSIVTNYGGVVRRSSRGIELLALYLNQIVDKSSVCLHIAEIMHFFPVNRLE